ncbi:uncharacterized protein LOC133817750 isoform X2 [Humulus lupulus]|uniref:uncharacterized protein LOC133817750 isoform X2 n=1 Tax=Humulus lupulus TaxID=3486 RepID=UPI002B416A47|nr:uncharacterized protein LOC133817750 isoform X2 [Humulus lupulus]
MVVVQASKLSLPNPSLSSSHVSSILFEPSSLSLALMHSDSSFSLYPSLSPLHQLSSLPPPQTLVPAPSSSSAFVLLKNPNSTNSKSGSESDSRVVFVVSGPYAGGSRILLRLYILQRQKKVFSRARVVCNQKDLRFDQRLGVLVDSVHGVSIKLAGSVNFMAMYSASSSKVWVFALKLVGDDNGDGIAVKLMRCAGIECCKPLFSISVSFGLLILGEENGVRAFNLRQLLKGRDSKAKRSQLNSNVRKLGLPNGVVQADVRGDRCGKCDVVEGTWEITCHCYLDGRKQKHLLSGKQRAIRLRQDSCEPGACFVAFSGKDAEELSARVKMSVKAISIQALSLKKFIILDSTGDLHLLCWSNHVPGLDMASHMRRLPRVMNVQRLAVLADSSIRTQTIWVSDGYHSLHMIAASDMETVVDENDRTENEEKLMQISVIRAIFSSEKIEDVIPLAANSTLVLGQGSLYAYEIS